MMERLGDIKHHRMRSQSPAQTAKRHGHVKTMSTPNAGRPVSTFSTASTLVSNSSPESKEKDRARDKVSELKPRPRTASSSSLHEIYQRHRHRSRSRKPQPVVESDESSTEEEIQEPLTAKQKPKTFMWRFGRRYLQDCDYMLPSDLQQTQLQNLNTILTTTALGGPLCSPIDPLNPPRAILDIGCGDGYWSSVCHDFFCCLNLPPPAFTGIDIAREGPDLTNLGLNWTFMNHDVKNGPLPFADESFDMIMSKDMGFSVTESQWMDLLPECHRVLKPGGYLEFRDRDYLFRRMMPPPDLSTAVTMEDEVIARETGCYYINSKSEFAECENKFLEQAGQWTRGLMQKRSLHPLPMRSLEHEWTWDGWDPFDVKRVAIPLSTALSWEKQPGTYKVRRQSQQTSVKLTADQRALRYTAQEVVLGHIEALEPLLRKGCSKNEEEWRRWWNGMVFNLVEENGAASGECLEIGACWGRKKSG